MIITRKCTVILSPLEEGGYQAFFPYYPNCVADGLPVDQALANTTNALEGVLHADAENDGDPVPTGVHAPHLVIGEIIARVPSILIEEPDSAPTIQ